MAIHDLKLPTPKMRTAWQLRHKQGLKDRQVGRAMCVSREQANRLINGFQRRLDEIRRWSAEHGDNTLVNQLLA